MGTAIKHPVSDRIKPSFVIFDIQTQTLSPECQSARMSKIANICHRMLYSCTRMATVGVKGF